MMNRNLALMVGGALLVVAPALGDGTFYRRGDTRVAASGPALPPAMQRGMSMPDMMKMHEKMMADMKASQATLDGLATKMNSAAGDAKIAAMADLLNELVRRHQQMGEHMGGMHQHMMGQMK
jgi:hypothetical protein